MEWISVKDRLPEENQIVFGITPQCTNNEIMVFEYQYIDGAIDENGNETSGWVWANCYGDITCFAPEWDDDYEVTHWMPLPESPNEDK